MVPLFFRALKDSHTIATWICWALLRSISHQENPRTCKFSGDYQSLMEYTLQLAQLAPFKVSNASSYINGMEKIQSTEGKRKTKKEKKS